MNHQSESDYIKIVVLESAIEAQLVASVLSERNIPYRLRSYHDTAYDGLFQVQKGWGEISAPQTSEQEITEIVNEIRAGATPEE
jgi:hypothetical protein